MPNILINGVNEAARAVYTQEKSFVESGLLSRKNPSIIHLEKLLLEMASQFKGELMQGVFYMLHLRNNSSKLTRFFESGSFFGSLNQMQSKISTKTIPSLSSATFRVYGEDDIFMEASRLEEKRDNISKKLCNTTPKSSMCIVAFEFNFYLLQFSLKFFT